MKTYKLHLLHGQMVSLNDCLTILFNYNFTLENINHITFYNLKSFMKRLHDKLFKMGDMIINPKYEYNISIDMNEAEALKELYLLNSESIEKNSHTSNLFSDVFAHIQKQETDLMNRHKFISPPIAIIQHKISSDNFKL